MATQQLTRICDLWIDVDRPGGLDCLLDPASSARRTLGVKWVVGDKFLLRIHLRRRAASVNGVPDPVQIASASTLVFAGAADVTPAEDSDPAILFSATGFSETIESDDVYYEAILDLDGTSESDLVAAMASVTLDGALDCLVDLEYQEAGNASRLTFRIPVQIIWDVYRSQGLPPPSVNPYPEAIDIVTKICATVALTSGQDSLVVTGLGLTSTPATVLLTVHHPAGGRLIHAGVDDSTISTDGFTANLSAAPPGAGYKLSYLLIT